MFTVAGPALWSACWITAVACALMARRAPGATRVGRTAVGILMLIGGALFNAIQLAQGNDYAAFADPSPFGWISRTWRAVVPDNLVLIGLLVVFEAAAGALLLAGERTARIGYPAVIAFHLLLWLFGWFEIVYCLLMLPALILLWRADHAGAAAAAREQGISVTAR